MSRFSFNHITAKHWPLPDLVAGCARAGVRQVGLWRDSVAEYGLSRTADLVRAGDVAVTSLCRGGFFGEDGWFDDNRRAIDEAAALGAPVLVLVSGGLPAGGRDIDGARARVAEAIGALAPYAGAAGVRLGIEPLHPMFASDRCVITTMRQALDIAEAHDPAQVGVVVDSYNIWWDDQVYAQIARAGTRIACVQISDWVTPLPAGSVTGRGLPGRGHIELARMCRAVTRAGYTGPIEVEVFNDEVWSWPGERALAEAMEGYRTALAGTDLDGD